MAGKSHSRKQSARKTSRRDGERRLIAVASAVILVAAASIGGMLALQYRSSVAPPPERPVVAAPAMPVHREAPVRQDPPQLPLYEEAVDPDALAPRPATPLEPMHSPVQPRAATHATPDGAPAELPAWRRYAVAVVPPAEPRPRIAVVIDDLGVDRPRSARVAALPPPLTVAYLPYAHDLETQTAAARRAGHELLVHVPMDPRNRKITDPGPNALLVDLDPDELQRRIDWNLSRFAGFVGINNHMGSRFTANREATDTVMTELRQRGLLFLDSRTSGASVALSEARRNGVPAVARDVFIDHIRTPEAVREALAHVEEIARKQGHAVAIGHPRDVTIEALTEWLPGLERRGFQRVPVSALVSRIGSSQRLRQARDELPIR